MRNIGRWFERMFIPNQKNLWKPHIFRPKNLFRLAVVLLILKFIAFSWLAYFPNTSHFAVVTTSELIELTNKERVAQGLQPLTVNSQLTQAAEKKAMNMINQDYFAHTSPDGLTPWYWLTKVGYKYTTAGENLAKGFTESIYVNNAWMNSPTHRANILNKNYQDIGIAVLKGTINGKETTIAVQFFGKVAQTKTVAISKTTKTETKQVATPDENKIEVTSSSVALTNKPVVQGQETVLNTVTNKSESWMQKIYMIILGIISLILMLTIFINIKVQYPKTILTVLIFMVLIAAIAVFNGSALLNKGINII